MLATLLTLYLWILAWLVIAAAVVVLVGILRVSGLEGFAQLVALIVLWPLAALGFLCYGVFSVVRAISSGRAPLR